jgi:cytochrome P450
MNFTLFLLALNPQSQAEVYNELNNIFGYEKRDITFEDLTKMKYLEMCIKETLRLYPPAPFSNRTTVEDTLFGS